MWPDMSSSPVPPRSRAPLVAIGALFFVNGASVASWFPRLPDVRDRLGISEAGLGLTLVGMGVGGLAISLLSGVVVDRFGSRRVAVFTSAVLSALLPLIGMASEAVVLFAVLIAIGMFDGLTDVAMNTQAVMVQEGRSHVMSRLHGMWSVGTLIGGLVSARAADAGVSMRSQLLVTSAVMVATTLSTRPFLLAGRPTTDDTPEAEASRTEATDGPGAAGRPAPGRTATALLLRLFLVGIAVALAEAPPNDWAALMWSDHYDLPDGRAALGYVSTVAGMVAGRFAGDFIVARLGNERTRRLGAAFAAVGVVLATLAPVPWASSIGLFATGFGVSQLFPMMMVGASVLTGGRSSGMAAFSSGARLGFLVGPPVVGGLAGLTSVATAVLIVAGAAAVTVAATPLRR